MVHLAADPADIAAHICVHVLEDTVSQLHELPRNLTYSIFFYSRWILIISIRLLYIYISCSQGFRVRKIFLCRCQYQNFNELSVNLFGQGEKDVKLPVEYSVDLNNPGIPFCCGYFGDIQGP